ncbi:nuclear transport factor 2 family protein [Spiractinospora alimapuensis]|uniref:nuclear transport factor 2 family protein n=1 Tax=Spiractinospora alimapuensis TaxID=2820884 RepID=UPI001F251552|nr:nuclear transport factor 2 family protein [Spiractinospora alimapuensis]QVQ52779.1 nuclear transport factor 2 family protein [Spiractinospora alimapuensis]
MTDVEARLERLENELSVLRDREAIRDVLYRYCRAVDRADTALLKDCYWPDGFDDHGFFGGNAMEFCDYITPLLRETTATTHAMSNPIIDLDGDTARVESQVDVLHRLQSESGDLIYEWIQCRYLDEFAKREGEWRILSRAVVTDGIFWSKMAAVITADRGLPLGDPTLLRGDRHPNDPVYRHVAGETVTREREALSDFWSGLDAVGKRL